VWCGLNDEAAAVTAQVDGAVNVEGSWAPDAKAESLERFQDGDLRVLVTKPSIAGFYESYYQAIRRCWRFGQTEPVEAHVVVSGLEQQIVANVQRKERDAAATVDRLIHHMNASREVAA
jgi:hypothetical protein